MNSISNDCNFLDKLTGDIENELITPEQAKQKLQKHSLNEYYSELINDINDENILEQIEEIRHVNCNDYDKSQYHNQY